jgi:hypothetical protein
LPETNGYAREGAAVAGPRLRAKHMLVRKMNFILMLKE